MARAAAAKGPGAAGSRYELLVKVASGGMATVYVGRRKDTPDARLWAVKRAHAHLLEEPKAKKMFIDEAKIASRIRHPNIVTVEAIEDLGSELRLIMEYIDGGALSDLIVAEPPLPPALAVRIALDASAGLHAAHHLVDEQGQPMHLVHRDVSPHNVLVGVDGVARLADFGIAKFARSTFSTTTGALKGKLAYMSPEYIGGRPPDARHDVFALGVVVWEMLAGRRLFRGKSEVDTMRAVLEADAPAISGVVPELSRDFDAVLGMALAKEPNDRFENAQAFASALQLCSERAGLTATHQDVGNHVRVALADKLAKRSAAIADHLVPSTRGRSSAPESATVPLDGRTIPMARAEPSNGLAAASAAAADGPETRPMNQAGRGSVSPMTLASPHTGSQIGVDRPVAVAISSPSHARLSDEVLASIESNDGHASPSTSDAETPASRLMPAGVPGRPRRQLGAWLLTAAVGLSIGGGLTWAFYEGGVEPSGTTASTSPKPPQQPAETSPTPSSAPSPDEVAEAPTTATTVESAPPPAPATASTFGGATSTTATVPGPMPTPPPTPPTATATAPVASSPTPAPGPTVKPNPFK